MHLVNPLISGIRGAENGTANFYMRGTTTSVTYYGTFEGGQSADGPLLLNSDGQATVYVSGLTRVLVTDTSGITVADFVAGDSAGGIEVISDSFQGSDYETGSIAAGEPTTLQAALDRVVASFGAPNFEVAYGATTVLVSALASTLRSLVGAVFNVKDVAYGADGDGIADDHAAIAAAITAAAVNGGIVFLPPGTYSTSDSLTLPYNVSLIGAGSGVTTIAPVHATNNAIIVTGSASSRRWQAISGFAILPGSGHAGHLISVNVSSLVLLHVSNCHLGNSAADGACIQATTTSTTSELLIEGCYFTEGAVNALNVRTTIKDCRMLSASGRLCQVSGLNLTVDNCYFDGSAYTGAGVTAVTTEAYVAVSSNAAITFRVTNCTFIAPAGNNLTAIQCNFPTSDCTATTVLYEYGNKFGSSVFAYHFRVAAASKGHKIWLGSRIGRRIEATDNAAVSVGQDALDYETYVVKRSTNADQTIGFAAGQDTSVPDGNRSTLFLWNESGGNISAETFSPAGSGSAVTINNNLSGMVHCVWLQVESVLAPYAVGIATVTGDPA